MKTCARCLISKPLDTFYHRKKGRDAGSPLSYCRPCNNKNQADWKRNNRERYLLIAKRSDQKLRAEVLAAYGGTCACCGESTPEFLTVDHILGDGKQHRKVVGAGGGVYRWLRKHNYPKEGFQLLCYNCNMTKGNNRACPHSKMRVECETHG